MEVVDKSGDEDSEDDKNQVPVQVLETVKNDEKVSSEAHPKPPSGQKRRSSSASTSVKKKKKVQPITITTASSTLATMSSRLDNCLSKVALLERSSDEKAKTKLVRAIKKGLTKLNNEKEVLIKYIQEQTPNDPLASLAEV